MNKPFQPPRPVPSSSHLILSWEDLRAALNALATPDRLKDVEDTLEACRALPASMGVGRAITIVSAIAWLTADDNQEVNPDGADAFRRSSEA